mmetsp:Transcript_19614/g.75283  ORF Transcript_19614/g.75283 Transcript_19614/m.75283 type:complete len:360 (+) Transcript_19614:56-1135(+)
MGNISACMGEDTPEAKEARKRNALANGLVQQLHEKQMGEISILFLGTAETGKSTMTRMFRIVSTLSFTEDERMQYRKLIRRAVVSAMQLLLSRAYEAEVDIQHQGLANRIMDVEPEEADENYTAQLATSIFAVWEDPAVQSMMAVAESQGYSVDWVPYLMEHCERFGREEFVPEDQDILRTRVVTSGIVETVLQVDGITWKLLDVGGQRVERKKWAYCFEGVTTIIFFVGLSDYDLPLTEDPTVNRLDESLTVFKKTINNIWFEAKPVVLFLNKKDLFEDKIKTVPLSMWDSSYTGENAYKPAVEYIKKRFLKVDRNPNRKIYVHETCALDANNIATVFKNVEHILHDALLDSILSMKF